MPDGPPPQLAQRLGRYDQLHLLHWWDELDAAQQSAFQRQLEAVDFALIKRLVSEWRDRKPTDCDPRAVGPPETIVELPQVEAQRAEAERVGEELLAAGKVGAIVVAGGQGTRLGFAHPKGMFPIGPVTQRTLFQVFAEQLRARSRRAGTTIPYYVMTSAATHDETTAFFEERHCFGLDRDAVFFFCQGAMPAVDAQSGKLLLSGKGSLALGPDGHGGLLAALSTSGLFDEMRSRGIEVLFYHQVDNPATVVCDPVFLGLHRLRGSQASTKVVSKSAAGERIGVVVAVEGCTQIIEYSDLPSVLAERTDADGRLSIRAGNTAIHAFDRDFLERMAAEDRLPFHVARKKMVHVDESGSLVEPATENALKFERFMFDVLPLARKPLVMEVERSREFLPVKNATGPDSPHTSRAGLCRLYADWLTSAGATVQPETAVEISPLYAIDERELRDKLTGGLVVDRTLVFEENGIRSPGA